MGFPYALSQKCEVWHFSLLASILPHFVADFHNVQPIKICPPLGTSDRFCKSFLIIFKQP